MANPMGCKDMLERASPSGAAKGIRRGLKSYMTNPGNETFAQLLSEQTKFCNELIAMARELMKRSGASEDNDEYLQYAVTADELVRVARLSSDKFEAKYATELSTLK